MKKKVITITLILILSFSFALTILPSVKANPHTDITVAQAASMIYSNSYPNLVIMDVRIASDYNARHIPGAINVPVIPPSPFDFTALNAWISSTEGQSHKNHEIIVYCASGTRSNLAADILDSNGFTKVYDMRGAFPAWTTAGYPTTGWTLVTDARAMKAYPDLKEYVWQKNATMPPNGQYDKIGLHRLVNTGIIPKGVIFITNCPTWGTGEERISNPATDNWTKYENFSQAIYWANRGFDVYAIDYRTHFAPKPFNATQASYAANWGWDVWISDIKDAAEKVKEVSGSSKFFISGECSGGEAALNYATKYASDLNGIILLDANFVGVLNYPIIGRTNETNSYNLTQAINNMNTTGNWTKDDLGSLRTISNYALQNPSAPAQYPPGTPLNPAINPLTNKTWANITEWYSWLVYNNFGVAGTPPGMWSNLVGGYGNVSQFEYSMANTEFVPLRLYLENMAMADWVNCPALTYDYNDHYSEINVPILAFEAGRLVNATGTFRFVNGTASSNFTGIVLPSYGHTDLFYGAYSARDVSEPAYQWMINHTLPTIIFSSGFEDGFNSWTSTYGGVSVVSSPVYFGNYSMKCSDPWGSLAAKTIGSQSETCTSAEFCFDKNFAGDETLIGYRYWNGNPTASMGISVQSGRIFVFVQTLLPSYSYSQYELTGFFAPGTWYKFALDVSATSATIYVNDHQVTSLSQTNIPATDSVNVGMFWGNGAYTGNLYVDNVQIGT